MICEREMPDFGKDLGLLIKEVEERKQLEIERLEKEREREDHIRKLLAAESGTLLERRRTNDLLSSMAAEIEKIRVSCPDDIKYKLEIVIQLLVFRFMNDGVKMTPELLREMGISTSINVMADGDLNIRDLVGRDKKNGD